MKIFCTLYFVLLVADVGKAQTNTLTDPRDGKIYKTVQIGSQIWMAENLSLKAIEFSSVGSKYDTIDTEIGMLYSWGVAQIACPSGWHLPSEQDFRTLLSTVGDNRSHQRDTLVNGKFNALNGGKFTGETFWSSTASKHMAVRFSFPGHGGHRVYLNKIDKSNYGSIRCLKNRE